MDNRTNPVLTFETVTDEDGMAHFWTLRDRYMHEDIIPNAEPPMDDEAVQWFFSDEYKNHLTALFSRETDPLRVAFLQQDGRYAGFIAYVVYHSEDGKCFVIEYCIEKDRRGTGLGARFFAAFEDLVKRDGATYMALNCSNSRNRCFWLARGFTESAPDEHGDTVYTKPL